MGSNHLLIITMETIILPFLKQKLEKVHLNKPLSFTIAGRLADKYSLLVHPSPYYIIPNEGPDRKVLMFILGALTGENM